MPPAVPPGYVYIETIGSGGLGEVYRVRNSQTSEDRALKVLRDIRRSGTEWITRFLREIRITSELAGRKGHVQYAEAVDIGGGAVGLLMELVEGETLHRAMVPNYTRRPLDPQKALEHCIGIAEALEVEHEHGILNRDVKDNNVIITPSDEVVLIDQGLTTNLDGRLVELGPVGRIVGTPHFMSPEQSRGERLTRASDLYSAGVILYAMLEGKLPFDENSISETIYLARSADVPRITNPHVPPQAARVAYRLLRKDPSSRYQDARSLISALEGALQAGGYSTGSSTQQGFGLTGGTGQGVVP